MLVAPFPDAVAERLPNPTLAPLVARLDHIGIVEHSYGHEPTADFGHCTDDAGRALGLAVQLARDPGASSVASSCLRQLDRSLQADGRFVVRLDEHGQPTDDDPSDDAAAAGPVGTRHRIDRHQPRRASTRCSSDSRAGSPIRIGTIHEPQLTPCSPAPRSCHRIRVLNAAGGSSK